MSNCTCRERPAPRDVLLLACGECPNGMVPCCRCGKPEWWPAFERYGALRRRGASLGDRPSLRARADARGHRPVGRLRARRFWDGGGTELSAVRIAADGGWPAIATTHPSYCSLPQTSHQFEADE